MKNPGKILSLLLLAGVICNALQAGDYHFNYHPNKTEVIYPSGSLATTTFDNAGQILSESQQSKDGQCKITTQFDYSNGYPSKVIHPNGSITTTK